ncbi:hypothetical protein SLA2020_339090 [Shorea laevis]
MLVLAQSLGKIPGKPERVIASNNTSEVLRDSSSSLTTSSQEGLSEQLRKNGTGNTPTGLPEGLNPLAAPSHIQNEMLGISP